MWDEDPRFEEKVREEVSEKFYKELELIRRFSTLELSDVRESTGLYSGNVTDLIVRHNFFNERSINLRLRANFQIVGSKFSAAFSYGASLEKDTRSTSDEGLFPAFYDVWKQRLKYEYGDRGGFTRLTKDQKKYLVLEYLLF